MNELQFKRATILVSDIDRSLSVYRDILGFTVNYIKDSADDSYSYPVFRIPKEAKIRFATLDSPTQERTIGLTEVTGIELPKPAHPIMFCQVIRVPNLDETIRKIKKLGLETTAVEMDSNDKFEFKEQSFVDHDGHLVVLYELLEK